MEFDEIGKSLRSERNTVHKWAEQLLDLEQVVAALAEEATACEQELLLLKSDFAAFKSGFKYLTSQTEAFTSQPNQVRLIGEKLFSAALQQEAEISLKEAEVQKLMNENLRLIALVDQKEGQLVSLE